jgi:bacillithiol system protein YtxJ
MPDFARLKNLFRNHEPPEASRPESMPVLRDESDWKKLLQLSNEQPVVLFKHSTRCDISDQVLKEFQDFTSRNESITYGIVNVVEDRRLSNSIAEEMRIQHQSPQAIVIENEQPVWHASHWSINAKELEEAVLR